MITGGLMGEIVNLVSGYQLCFSQIRDSGTVPRGCKVLDYKQFQWLPKEQMTVSIRFRGILGKSFPMK